MNVTSYKMHIHNREYTSWTIYNTTNFQEVDIPWINPLERRFLTNDIFTINEESRETHVTHSSIRLSNSIPGVLILKDNKTYGRDKTNGKLLYRCVPDDIRLPTFLVPYEFKNLGFSKVFSNQYITFNFVIWTEKHPIGVISQKIGNVDILDNYYEYQLYCKSLNASIQKFNKDTSKAIKMAASHDEFINGISKKFPCIQDRTCKKDWYIFTIDPSKSVDLDDGFSINLEENGSHRLSIYISNVTIWMDILNLWDSFSMRISTIYLPDRKRPMLPTILSDCLCSLLSNHTRIAFVMDIFINKDNEISNIEFSNCKINVSNNYTYEDHSLLDNPKYKLLLNMCKKLSTKYTYMTNIKNSHEVVSYLMVLMNFHTAKNLLQNQNGIFRSTILKRDVVIPPNIPEDVVKFIKIWNSSSGQYIDAASLKVGQTLAHDMLEMDAYVHITSPIRRLVDLLNIIRFQCNTGMIALSENAERFYNKWIDDLEYINTAMRSIRRMQNECSLLHICSTDQELLSKTYDGYSFDKVRRNDGLYQMVVYLPELKLTSRIIVKDDIGSYERKQYKLYIFHNEEKFKKKIRLQVQ